VKKNRNPLVAVGQSLSPMTKTSKIVLIFVFVVNDGRKEIGRNSRGPECGVKNITRNLINWLNALTIREVIIDLNYQYL
jgi:hypothetical protein